MVGAEMDDLGPGSLATCVLGRHVPLLILVSLILPHFTRNMTGRELFFSIWKMRKQSSGGLRSTTRTPRLAHPSGADGEVSFPSGKVTMVG